MLSNKVKVLNKLKGNFPLFLGVVLILLVIVMLVLSADRAVQVTPEAQTDQTGVLAPEVSLPSDQAEVLLGDESILVPEGWQIDLVYSNDLNTGFRCEGESGCSIYNVIGDEDKTLEKIEVSTPSLIWSEFVDDFDIEDWQEYRYGEEKIAFSAVFYSDDDGNSTIPAEISGCSSAKVCFHVGELSGDSEENKKQLSEFANFLTKVKVKQ